VALTDAFKQSMTARGINTTKISVIKNGADLREFAPAPKDQALLQTLGLQGKFIVCYIGTHGMAHKLDFILRCAALLDEQDSTHFLLVGDGAEKEKLLALKQELGLANVTMLDAAPRQQAARYLGLADAALVPLKKTPTFKTVIPSKIFESAAMQKPILLGVDGEARALIEQYHAGLYFEPENEKGFLNQLKRLKDNKALQESLIQGCRNLAADFDRDKLAESMFEILKGLCPPEVRA
jgi:glycosyltransferase involved in cell wall biosynthesis